MAAAQELEKVDPALALGALEPREPLVADVRAVAVLALVTRPRVVDVDVPRDPQTHREDSVLLPVEPFFAFNDQRVQLARRDRHPILVELLEQKRLGHKRVIVLIENEAAHRRAEVAAASHCRRQIPGDQLARRR